MAGRSIADTTSAGLVSGATKSTGTFSCNKVERESEREREKDRQTEKERERERKRERETVRGLVTYPLKPLGQQLIQEASDPEHRQGPLPEALTAPSQYVTLWRTPDQQNNWNGNIKN